MASEWSASGTSLTRRTIWSASDDRSWISAAGDGQNICGSYVRVGPFASKPRGRFSRPAPPQHAKLAHSSPGTGDTGVTLYLQGGEKCERPQTNRWQGMLSPSSWQAGEEAGYWN